MDLKQQTIEYLKTLDIEELGDVLISVGAFRNSSVPKEEVEDANGIELYYDEYQSIDYVDVFLFPREKPFWEE